MRFLFLRMPQSSGEHTLHTVKAAVWIILNVLTVEQSFSKSSGRTLFLKCVSSTSSNYHNVSITTELLFWAVPDPDEPMRLTPQRGRARPAERGTALNKITHAIFSLTREGSEGGRGWKQWLLYAFFLSTSCPFHPASSACARAAFLKFDIVRGWVWREWNQDGFF